MITNTETLTFDNNILNIENTIDTNIINNINFVLPAGDSISNLIVTDFVGTGTITYTLSKPGTGTSSDTSDGEKGGGLTLDMGGLGGGGTTSGTTTDITGTITAKDVNILDGTPIFAIDTDIIYTLELTADAAINYKIVGTKLYTMGSSEYSVTELIVAGYTEQQLIDGNFWIADDDANCLLPIYNEDFLDISGGNVIVRNSFIMGSGNIDLSNVLIKQPCTFDTAILNTRLFVIGDVSMGTAGLNVAGDITIDGNLSVESYKDNSISPSAIQNEAGGSITSGNITTITNDASYDKLQMNGDVSLNSTINNDGVYQVSSDKVTNFGASTKLKLTNGIQFSDNTIVNTTNISSGTYAANNVVFKPSHFNNMTVTGDFASNPPLTASDYRIKTNIQELDETHTIDKLRPVTYYQNQLKKNAIGFIAHELQEYYPELVEGEKDGDKMQSVNYTGILAILINEIKNLKQNIKDTRNILSSQTSAL